jgi:dethiobiotin synthetase
MRSLLITGTDTGVGKTFVGCGLAAALMARGKSVGVLKPTETGCALRAGELLPDDALRLATFARDTLPIDQICPYRFEPPLAPSVAAQMAGVSIDPQRLRTLFQQRRSQYDVMLVEGAGGLLVPLVGRYTFADLARDLGTALLVVVGSKLGALNHTLLTFHCAHAMTLPVAGYIVNHPLATSDLATQTNVQSLAGLLDVPCRGVVPFTPLSGETEQDRTQMAALFSATIDLDGLFG